MRSEVEQCTDRVNVRQQRFPSQVRKGLFRDEETVRPDQTAVPPNQPAIADVAVQDCLTVCGSTEHQPFQRHQLSAAAEIDFDLPMNAGGVEDDRFLWKPGQLRGIADVQSRDNLRWLIEGPIDLLGCLRCHGYPGITQRGDLEFQPVTSGNAARSIDDDRFPDRPEGGVTKANGWSRPASIAMVRNQNPASPCGLL